MEIPLSIIYEVIMGTVNTSCKLSNLGKFKCYTKSGSKIVYEDDGLTKGQSFIIFPNKTILSTGECEYTIGLTGNLEDNYPWKGWSYIGYPNDAIPGNTYSYKIEGSPIILSNYKGVTVTGIPSKTWSWDRNLDITILLKLYYNFQNGLGYSFTLRHPVYYDINSKMINITYSVKVNLYKPSGDKIKEITISITTSNGFGTATSVYHDYNDCTAGLQAETATFSPKSGTLQNGGKFTIQEPKGFS